MLTSPCQGFQLPLDHKDKNISIVYTYFCYGKIRNHNVCFLKCRYFVVLYNKTSPQKCNDCPTLLYVLFFLSSKTDKKRSWQLNTSFVIAKTKQDIILTARNDRQKSKSQTSTNTITISFISKRSRQILVSHIALQTSYYTFMDLIVECLGLNSD